jgi:hypothetical protein
VWGRYNGKTIKVYYSGRVKRESLNKVPYSVGIHRLIPRSRPRDIADSLLRTTIQAFTKILS